ncbi:MAG: dTDP-4-dehydrorhamnose reductase [Selenomonas sp.]|uniref:dTDP-4-dehydrorhamnose reductase n=1 Tax=Selenomonas sp. TaxID=2053611 RepID=UPI0025EE8FB2|nr:dTDP-4-dehydrorhamnose reductase [Selenomonas sp.]MCI6085579.1 dTDP-4-dehydrorhamnose reductase [Selenomonas sp.]
MKILVTGVTGQLGHDVMLELQSRGHEAIGAARKDFSLIDFKAARAFVERTHPDAIIHCAAYTAVDRAEDEKDICMITNGGATRALAAAAKDIGAKFVYLSTDYVFPGTGETPYETDALKGPTNAYGLSKLAGETAVQELLTAYFIVRISWVFGVNGKNFVKTMLRLAEDHDALTVVDDQIGSPTYTKDLARLLVDMVESEKYGVYHATNEGFCSWAEFAAEIFRQAGERVTVTPVPSSAYPTKAARPKNSRLSKAALDAAGFSRLPTWQDALQRYLGELSL